MSLSEVLTKLVCNPCVGLLFTLEYEDKVGDIHWLKVHKVTGSLL